MKRNITSVNLSELEDHIEISIEESSEVLTVGDLKRDILERNETDHEYSNWYTIQRKRWKPDANRMVRVYIEQEYDDMYEDWDERAMDCLNTTVVGNIQLLLDEAFKGDTATEYWSYETPVVIDLFPDGKKPEWSVGDSVTTTYTNIKNKTGKIISIYKHSCAIEEEDGQLSHHKLDRLVRSEEAPQWQKNGTKFNPLA